MIGFLLLLYGPPSIVAAIPGFWLLAEKRPIAGCLITIGGIIAAIPLPIIMDRMRTARLSEAGVIVDDFSFLVMPWFFGLAYMVLGAILAVCVVYLAPRKASNV